MRRVRARREVSFEQLARQRQLSNEKPVDVAGSPHHSGLKQSILADQPFSSALLPCIEPKAKSSQSFESIRLFTAGAPAPLGLLSNMMHTSGFTRKNSCAP